MGGFVKRRVLWSLAAIAAAAIPAASAWAACYSPAEATAVHVRMLQSELMVAALACRESNPELGMIDKYNRFVQLHSDGLVSHSRVLQSHFQTRYGAQHRRQMDTFVTALANDASKRSMTEKFCDRAAGLFGEISALERRDLGRFSTARAAANGSPVATCTSDSGGLKRTAAGQ